LPALSDNESKAGTLRTWAEQVGNQGGRVFYRADVASMEAAVHAAGPARLSVYEVVTEGLLVRPFYDLEYSKVSNPLRTCDDALLSAIVDSTDKAVRDSTGVGVGRTIVLDSSDAAKCSVHIIIHLQHNCALHSIKDAQCLARVLARQVVASLPAGLNQVMGADGSERSVVDLAVYKRNQQFRIMGCVKHGDARVLRPHHCMTDVVSLLDTLICMPASKPGLHVDSTSASGPAQPGHVVASRHPVDAYLPELVSFLTGVLGCSIYNMQRHASRGSACPSLYLHTNSLQCAARLHASNHSVVEVRCDNLQWRLLCRDGCKKRPVA
jgi:hypothetical protein